MVAADNFFTTREVSRAKGCPRSAFLGLCENGWVKGIPPTGEWTGGHWVEISGPSLEDIENVRESLIAIANAERSSLMSQASDMIGALSDEIEGLEDSNSDVPDKLRADLKAWKQYRVKVKNIDVSLTPDIEWPAAPE